MRGPWNAMTTVALAAAALVSLALLVLALVVPVYATESQSATVDGGPAEVVRGTATLVSVNGYGALVVVAVPLVVTLLVGLLLRRGSTIVEYVAAWAITLLYGGLCVLALLSIGMFLAPVALALVVACATARLDRALAVGREPASA
jgi:hypothetical protein